MAVKGGAIITTANGDTVLKRVQSAGPGSVTINTEKIDELGNYKSVATVRDTPDLTFSYESFDVSCATEAALTSQYEGRAVADAVIAAGDATVTSDDAVFSAADVGRLVVIAGAGVGGREHVTTIDSVTDASTVELVDAPVTAVAAASMRITQNGYDLASARPMDVASQFKAGKDAADPFKVISSVAVPFLYLEQMSYRFGGPQENASQQGQLRGDSIFYNPGASYVESHPGSGAAAQAIATAHPAFQLAEADQRRVLCVTAGPNRLVLGADYTETYGAVVGGAAITTIHLLDTYDADTDIRIVYSSPDELHYPQNTAVPASVVPAAVKGRDIDVYVGGYDPNVAPAAQTHRLPGVQQISLDWRVTLQKDEEFGNYFAVAQDFDTPAVTGSVDIMPRDPADLQKRLRQFAGVEDATKVIGTATAVPLPLDIVIRNPDTGVPLKRLSVDDARFTAPGLTGRVNAKTVVTISFESDEGDLLIFER